ncbi:MAG TPA: CHASE3 domain-containing protein [Candidatus Binatia bacterium]|nr:CHASE3 domain-containing protein [Candidatus Binatia bacterium]
MSSETSENIQQGRGRLGTLFLAAAALLAVSIGLTYWVGTVAVESGRKLARERAVFQRLEEMVSTLSDLERSELGYLLTGEERYLEPYPAGEERARVRVDQLQQLASSGDLPSEQVQRVVALTEQKLTELADTIRARRERGLDAALAIVTTERGRQLMEAIRSEVAQMEAGEEEDLRKASQKAEQAQVVRTLVFLVAGLVNLMFLGWAYARISREMASREAAVLEAQRQSELLATSEERFRLATEALMGLLYDWNIPNNTVLRSAGLKELTGYEPAEAPNHGDWWLERIHPGDRADVIARTKQMFVERAPAMESEYRLVRREGGTIYVSDRARVVYDAAGQPLRMVGSITDITARKQFQAELERQVAERTRSLQETTDQLNAFCYSIAHDLRAPLRAQQAFACLLLDEFRAALGKTGVEYVERIAKAAEQQGHLVEDLLTQMSVGRADLPMAPVELARAIAQARADLAMEEEQKQARVEVGALHGSVLANAASLHLVVLNLLSNALKFVPAGVGPEVKLWTEQRGSFTRLWVEDKGIGIEPQYQNKLFGVFQRLHSSAEYPGTGIGLAIVKRAVERMEGRVGVESEPGKGSRFWVELRSAEGGSGQ